MIFIIIEIYKYVSYPPIILKLLWILFTYFVIYNKIYLLYKKVFLHAKYVYQIGKQLLFIIINCLIKENESGPEKSFRRC